MYIHQAKASQAPLSAPGPPQTNATHFISSHLIFIKNHRPIPSRSTKRNIHSTLPSPPCHNVPCQDVYAPNPNKPRPNSALNLYHKSHLNNTSTSIPSPLTHSADPKSVIDKVEPSMLYILETKVLEIKRFVLRDSRCFLFVASSRLISIL